jgi:NAD-dependent SIR2 family protein deacetylase
MDGCKSILNIAMKQKEQLQMSLLTFKCEECGHRVWKIRKIIDIFFLIKNKIIRCKQCKYRYRVVNKTTFLPFPFINFIINIFEACIFFVSMIIADTLFYKMGSLLKFTAAITIAAVIIFVFIGFVFAILYSVNKVNYEE